MTKSITINSHGSGSFGNVLQGDRNSVSATLSIQSDSAEELERLRQQAGVSAEEVARLKRELSEWEESVRIHGENEPQASGFKVILERFSWAIPVLKVFVEKVAPKIAGMIIGTGV